MPGFLIKKAGEDAMFEFAIAFALIAQPENTAADPKLAVMASVIREVCIGLDLFTRENCYTMNPKLVGFDFQDHLDNCRRWWGCVKDAPDAGDLYRLPNREALEAWMRFNREVKAHLEMKQIIHPSLHEDIQEAINDLERRCSALSFMQAAWANINFGWWRRHYMQQARLLLGDDAYWSGRWDWVPLSP